MFIEFRKDYGLSQNECEKLSGISHQRISEFERIEKKRRFKVTKKMCDYAKFIKEYRATHLTTREMAEQLAEENKGKVRINIIYALLGEIHDKMERKKTIWQKIKNFFGVK